MLINFVSYRIKRCLCVNMFKCIYFYMSKKAFVLIEIGLGDIGSSGIGSSGICRIGIGSNCHVPEVYAPVA